MLFQKKWTNEVPKLHNRYTFSPRRSCGSFSTLTAPTTTIQQKDAGLISAVPEAILHIAASLPVLQNYINKYVILGVPLKIRILNTPQRTRQRATLPQHSKLCCLFGTVASPSFGWFWTEVLPTKQPYDLTAFQSRVKISGSTELLLRANIKFSSPSWLRAVLLAVKSPPPPASAGQTP